MAKFVESIVEDAALGWLEKLEYTAKNELEIVPGELYAERKDYAQVILEDQLHQGLTRLNPDLPVEAVEDAFRKILRPEGPTLETRNRAFQRMLVDGVTVEHRRLDETISGA